MPNWTASVPARDGPRSMPLRRTPQGSKILACITSPHLIGCNTHFYQGHTVPCSAPDCEACGKGVPWAWHGYVGAMAAGTREHFLFEFTPQVGDILQDYEKHHGTLRGCLFTAQRHNSRPNGRVIIQTKPGDLAQLNLPKPPDLEACMGIIWNIERNTIVPADRTKNSLRVHHDPNKEIVDRLVGSQKTNGNGV